MLHAQVTNVELLQLFAQIADVTRSQLSEKIPTPGYPCIENIVLTSELVNTCNNLLSTIGVSPLKNVLAFKRVGGVVAPDNCHIDGNTNDVCNCSIVIPVDNTKGTLHYWYVGLSDINRVRLNTSSNTEYNMLVWREVPSFVEAIQVETPMLMRTDIPHSATGRLDAPRLTCTIRFQQNESFEYLYSKMC